MANGGIMTGEGIYSYYKNLAYGDKDKFVIQVAEALEMSSQNVRRKIATKVWKSYEVKFVEGIINS